MDGADHLFAIILLVSATVGFFRGFVRESIALAAWLVGLWVAWHYAWVVNPWLGGALAEPGVREWTGRAVVLLLVLLLGSLAGSIVSYYVRRAVAVAAVDRLLGVAFGLLRGAVLIGLFVLVGRAVNLDDFRFESPLFTWGPLPADNIFGDPAAEGVESPAVDAGYYLMLAPLSVGQHVIEFGATFDAFGASINTVYLVTVEP